MGVLHITALTISRFAYGDGNFRYHNLRKMKTHEYCSA
jgi:hypothetical protein